MTASPAGVISPVVTRRRQRTRFCSHQLLPLRRGVKRWTGFPSSIRFRTVDAQPKVGGFVVVFLVPPVKFLPGMNVKQGGDFHGSSLYSSIVRE